MHGFKAFLQAACYTRPLHGEGRQRAFAKIGEADRGVIKHRSVSLNTEIDAPGFLIEAVNKAA